MLNKQNCCIWSHKKHACIRKKLGIIGSYFLQDAQERRVAVNEVRYRVMLNDYFFLIVIIANETNIHFTTHLSYHGDMISNNLRKGKQTASAAFKVFRPEKQVQNLMYVV